MITAPDTRQQFVVEHLDDAMCTRLVNGSVSPRPIAWIGTQSAAGVNNLAPFSYFNAVSSSPPKMMVSMAVRNGRVKDSLANIIDTGELTINVVNHAHARSMNETSAAVSADVDEFALARVRAESAIDISAPLVADAPVSMECRADLIHPLGPVDADHYVLVVASVIRFHVRRSLLDERGRIDQSQLDTIARMGGTTYATTRDRFELGRP